jgi:hypothetical protein
MPYKFVADVKYPDESRPIKTPEYERRFPHELGQMVTDLIRKEPDASEYIITIKRDDA